jgi:hypothetical protein
MSDGHVGDIRWARAGLTRSRREGLEIVNTATKSTPRSSQALGRMRYGQELYFPNRKEPEFRNRASAIEGPKIGDPVLQRGPLFLQPCLPIGSKLRRNLGVRTLSRAHFCHVSFKLLTFFLTPTTCRRCQLGTRHRIPALWATPLFTLKRSSRPAIYAVLVHLRSMLLLHGLVSC